jgi:hypothetical protein
VTRNSGTTGTYGGAERLRLDEDARREKNWKRWGPYLAERQWGTVREDYSAEGKSWGYFTHEQSRSRVYRWGEDGLLGITDRKGRLSFALGLWNEKDPILKERLFGLTGPEGNHGEDVKELYFYLDSTPTHSYMRALYKYPQVEFPYARLVEENRRRSKTEREFELCDTGALDSGYWDVYAEYAKGEPDDVLIRIQVVNQANRLAVLHVLPTVWFRNTWFSGRTGEGYWAEPRIEAETTTRLRLEHASLGTFHFAFEAGPDGVVPPVLFTDNETNVEKLFGGPRRHAKDAFHEYLIGGDTTAVRREPFGTKAAPHYRIELGGGERTELRLRLTSAADAATFPDASIGANFDEVFRARQREADAFYNERLPDGATADEASIIRQGYAGLLWTKQFYHYSVKDWLKGDAEQPAPPEGRTHGRNRDWGHLYNRDVLSMPDKWEYPWFAAWDLAFHMVPFATIDPAFAKEQLLLLLREWYMHPNGQMPAYEFNFSDVNPPVHAWAAWRVYKLTGPPGKRDRQFLARVFQKLLFNFTWWVNRKDEDGNHIFAGGFLGLDNIGVFDRSRELPTGGVLEQADGTAWVAFYCATMLSMALELAREDKTYGDVASKFFEHFVAVTDAINTLGGTGLWDEQDGFYYDHLRVDHETVPLRVRSMVGLLPLMTVEVLEESLIDELPDFKKRMLWFLENRPRLAEHVHYSRAGDQGHYLLAIPSQERLCRVLRVLLDEGEFLSPFGIRSLSRFHEAHPFVFHVGAEKYEVAYLPGESDSYLFGGNSNWRGPIWFPLNFLAIEALERYHHYYGEALQVEYPTGSGDSHSLLEIAADLAARLTSLFLPADDGRRPCHGAEARFEVGGPWQELALFYEYFHSESGEGLGASHQTGWTALVLRCLEKGARRRKAEDGSNHRRARVEGR